MSSPVLDKRPVGRPVVVGGKRVQVYLDAESLAVAAHIGNGNVSDGIRKALRNAKRQDQRKQQRNSA